MAKPAAPAPWSGVLAIAVGAFALITAEFLPVGLLPQIAHELVVSDGKVGLMITIPGIVAACSAICTVSWGKSFDRKLVLCVLLGLLAASNALIAVSGGLATLLAGRVLLGIAVGGFWTIGISVGPRLRPDAAVRATSLIFSGVTIGTVAGVPLGTFLGDHLGWRTAFGSSAALALAVVGALAILLPRIPSKQASGLAQLPGVLRTRKVHVGLIALVLIFIGQFAAYTYIAPYLVLVSGIRPGALSAFLLAYGVAGIFGNLFSAWVAARNVRLAVLGTSLLLGLSMAALLASGNNPAIALAAVVGWGFGFGMLPIAMQGWIFAAAPDRLESAAALFVSIGQLAMGAGALAGGMAVDRLGIQSSVWLGTTGAMAAAAYISLRFPKRGD